MVAKLLIANRGEIAIRIARAAAALGLQSAAVYAQDDAQALHVAKTDEAIALPGIGVKAYLDGAAILAAAKVSGADAIHPGYGFLSENADFARAVKEAGLVFVGPDPGVLGLFGDKRRAREMAQKLNIPVPNGLQEVKTRAEVEQFFLRRGGAPILIKAAFGGGGRGIRMVRRGAELAEAFAQAQTEAMQNFGQNAIYVEQVVTEARHIEIQVAGDGDGGLVSFGERDCTTQRRRQKLIEIAPAPQLHPNVRARLNEAALKLARSSGLKNLATFEFLVQDGRKADDGLYFVEANARLQVEHTVTEEVYGVDLVRLQLQLAQGVKLSHLGLNGALAPPHRVAIQLRVNCEIYDAEGRLTPTEGELSVFEPPLGPGVRVDSCAYAGGSAGGVYDSLLAKIIVTAPDFDQARAKASYALDELRIEGVKTNAPFLRAILHHPQFAFARMTTDFVDRATLDLAKSFARSERRLYFSPDLRSKPAVASEGATPGLSAPEGQTAVRAKISGILSAIAAPGQKVRAGEILAIIEAMKMEHPIVAQGHGVVRAALRQVGERASAEQTLLFVEFFREDDDAPAAQGGEAVDAWPQTLEEFFERRVKILDENRPEAIARRRAAGKRTARENVYDLTEGGPFHEYGGLATAARRNILSREDLALLTPADGVIAGLGVVNASWFGEDSHAFIVAYDYTVMAGTQGAMNHKKQDRVFKLALELRLPVVLFAEGGGGRPGDTDFMGTTGLDVPTFARFASLSGKVALVGVASGRCFAGNAALLGCCDVVIATQDANIGMGGPAMIEGAGLGSVQPEEIGPATRQARNGVVDVLVADEAEAVAAARKILSYFQGRLKDWRAGDPTKLRRAIPENRLRVYDMRAVIQDLCDQDSLIELRENFGIGVITALVRIEGRAFGLMANNPMHLGGAIDAQAAEKACWFLQFCDMRALPILSLCDTPGFMVGPAAEDEGLARRASQMFLTAANLTTPWFAVVLRKGYGLGAQAMTGGGFHEPVFTVAWPSGEFGAMGLEGAVRLSRRKELEAIPDPDARAAHFKKLVAREYELGKAIAVAEVMEIDAVIDPAETRAWVLAGLAAYKRAEKN